MEEEEVTKDVDVEETEDVNPLDGDSDEEKLDVEDDVMGSDDEDDDDDEDEEDGAKPDEA